MASVPPGQLQPRKASTALEIYPNAWVVGNDGNWSSFPIDIGSPVQRLDVLVSLKNAFLSLPSPEYCQQTKPLDCVPFKANESESWNTTDGADAVQLLLDGTPSLGNQRIELLALWPGTIGLLPLPSLNAPLAFTGTNASHSTLLQTLKSKGLIPSLSYSYYAGSSSRNTPASLVLGGWDLSLAANPPPLSTHFGFSPDLNNLFVVKLDGLKLDTSSSAPLLDETVDAVLDTATPYLELPQAICDRLASNFGLALNRTSGLFTVNESTHNKLRNLNPNVTFSLKNSISSKNSIDITLPYSSFALLTNESIEHFPIRVAENRSRAILGRTFFQEAYIVVDFEAQYFIISGINHHARASAHEIVNIYPPLKNSLTTVIVIGIFFFILVSLLCTGEYRRTRRFRKLEKIWEDMHMLDEVEDESEGLTSGALAITDPDIDVRGGEV